LGAPYYKKAQLRFECQRCGACCSTWQGKVYVHPEDIPGLASAMDFLPGQFLQEYTRRDLLGHRHLVLKSNGHCIFHENGKCIVNDVKPGACHAWPFWRSVCTTRRGWERAMKRCPGMGRGRVWTVEEIEARMALSP
jgi:Fe-S-cluster containining protein